MKSLIKKLGGPEVASIIGIALVFIVFLVIALFVGGNVPHGHTH